MADRAPLTNQQVVDAIGDLLILKTALPAGLLALKTAEALAVLTPHVRRIEAERNGLVLRHAVLGDDQKPVTFKGADGRDRVALVDAAAFQAEETELMSAACPAIVERFTMADIAAIEAKALPTVAVSFVGLLPLIDRGT